MNGLPVHRGPSGRRQVRIASIKMECCLVWSGVVLLAVVGQVRTGSHSVFRCTIAAPRPHFLYHTLTFPSTLCCPALPYNTLT